MIKPLVPVASSPAPPPAAPRFSLKSQVPQGERVGVAFCRRASIVSDLCFRFAAIYEAHFFALRGGRVVSQIMPLALKADVHGGPCFSHRQMVPQAPGSVR